MAVYTKVNLVEAQNFINKNYELEDILSITEISEGVENTNYILETRNNKYILTLYEDRVSVSDLPFFIDLMVYLDNRNIVCPKPISMKSGKYIKVLNDRHAAIFSFLSGKSTQKITNKNCFLVGQTLANLHEQTSEIKIMRQNQLSQKYLHELFDSIENETFTIRKMSGSIGVERIFPINSPSIQKIEINKRGKVRRARIFYFRNLTGKKAKIKEKRN